jgi:hypothetical protein
MLPVRFEDITDADVLRLIDLKTVERKTLEYKAHDVGSGRKLSRRSEPTS